MIRVKHNRRKISHLVHLISVPEIELAEQRTSEGKTSEKSIIENTNSDLSLIISDQGAYYFSLKLYVSQGGYYRE